MHEEMDLSAWETTKEKKKRAGTNAIPQALDVTGCHFKAPGGKERLYNSVLGVFHTGSFVFSLTLSAFY